MHTVLRSSLSSKYQYRFFFFTYYVTPRHRRKKYIVEKSISTAVSDRHYYTSIALCSIVYAYTYITFWSHWRKLSRYARISGFTIPKCTCHVPIYRPLWCFGTGIISIFSLKISIFYYSFRSRATYRWIWWRISDGAINITGEEATPLTISPEADWWRFRHGGSSTRVGHDSAARAKCHFPLQKSIPLMQCYAPHQRTPWRRPRTIPARPAV